MSGWICNESELLSWAILLYHLLICEYSDTMFREAVQKRLMVQRPKGENDLATVRCKDAVARLEELLSQ